MKCRQARIENTTTLQFPNIQQVTNGDLIQEEHLYSHFVNITSNFKVALTNLSQQYCYGGKPFVEHNSLSFRHSYTEPSPNVWPLV
jgi:hypothetical protein